MPSGLWDAGCGGNPGARGGGLWWAPILRAPGGRPLDWSSRGWRVSPRGWSCFPNTPKGGNGAAPFLRAWGKSLSVRGYVRFYPAAGRASSQVGAAVLARPSAGSQGRRGRRALSAPLRSSLPAGGQRQPRAPRLLFPHRVPLRCLSQHRPRHRPEPGARLLAAAASWDGERPKVWGLSLPQPRNFRVRCSSDTLD